MNFFLLITFLNLKKIKSNVKIGRLTNTKSAFITQIFAIVLFLFYTRFGYFKSRKYTSNILWFCKNSPSSITNLHQNNKKNKSMPTFNISVILITIFQCI
eukprot:UN02363